MDGAPRLRLGARALLHKLRQGGSGGQNPRPVAGPCAPRLGIPGPARTQGAPEAPAGYTIKGNVTRNGKIYHMPSSPWYAQIRIAPDKGKRWFCTEAEAIAAGWRPVAAR